jgi:hypothetical protein
MALPTHDPSFFQRSWRGLRQDPMQIFRHDPMRHDVAARSVAWMKSTHTELNLTHVNSRGWGPSPGTLKPEFENSVKNEQSQEKQDALSKT